MNTGDQEERTRAGSQPVAATRLDATYGHRGTCWRFYGLIVMLERVVDVPVPAKG